MFLPLSLSFVVPMIDVDHDVVGPPHQPLLQSHCGTRNPWTKYNKNRLLRRLGQSQRVFSFQSKRVFRFYWLLQRLFLIPRAAFRFFRLRFEIEMVREDGRKQCDLILFSIAEIPPGGVDDWRWKPSSDVVARDEEVFTS